MERELSHFLNNKNFRRKRTSRDPSSYTSASKQSDIHWSQDENKLFFKYLPQTGLDFTMLSSFFPHKTRKQVLAKYKRELKRNKELIENLVQSQKPYVTIQKTDAQENVEQENKSATQENDEKEQENLE